MKIHFDFDPNCTDPNTKPIPFAELWLEEDHLGRWIGYQFGYVNQPEDLGSDEITIQLLREYPRLIEETLRSSRGIHCTEVSRLFGAGAPTALTVFVSSVEI